MGVSFIGYSDNLKCNAKLLKCTVYNVSENVRIDSLSKCYKPKQNLELSSKEKVKSTEPHDIFSWTKVYRSPILRNKSKTSEKILLSNIKSANSIKTEFVAENISRTKEESRPKRICLPATNEFTTDIVGIIPTQKRSFFGIVLKLLCPCCGIGGEDQQDAYTSEKLADLNKKEYFRTTSFQYQMRMYKLLIKFFRTQIQMYLKRMLK